MTALDGARCVAAASLSSPSSHGDATLNCTDFADKNTFFLGQGSCVGNNGNTTAGYTCVSGACPIKDLGDAQACSLVCSDSPACTGFEVRLPSPPSSSSSNSSSRGAEETFPHCIVFLSAPPKTGIGSAWPWTKVNGTQTAGNGLAVAASDGSPNACCYKKPYPSPNPLNNPCLLYTSPSPRDRG